MSISKNEEAFMKIISKFVWGIIFFLDWMFWGICFFWEFLSAEDNNPPKASVNLFIGSIGNIWLLSLVLVPIVGWSTFGNVLPFFVLYLIVGGFLIGLFNQSELCLSGSIGEFDFDWLTWPLDVWKFQTDGTKIFRFFIIRGLAITGIIVLLISVVLVFTHNFFWASSLAVVYWLLFCFSGMFSDEASWES